MSNQMTFVCVRCLQDKIIYSGNLCKECFEVLNNGFKMQLRIV